MRKSDQGTGVARIRPKARVIHTLGDELISDDTVALTELVKNAYDADADGVLVDLSGITAGQDSRIVIVDNGCGMTLDTVLSAWMEPATLQKTKVRTTKRGRRVLGEKGIGRFAASRLGRILEMVTRSRGNEQEIRVIFDWKQFDAEDAYLDEVEVHWEERAPTELRRLGTLEKFLRRLDRRRGRDSTHGTILHIRELQTRWGARDLEKLYRSLSRLVSPFEQPTDFRIFLDVPEQVQKLGGEVQAPPSLGFPDYLIKGPVRAEGQYELTYESGGTEEATEGRLELADGRQPGCGPFEIELRVWDLDPPSLDRLARRLDSTRRDLRQDLKDAAGISIYRDGFRVLPYGEWGNDWLGLDLRRVQNPTMRVSNNQVVGYIHISAERNPELRDQSNREGLIATPAFEDIRHFTVQILSELEKRRYKARPREKARPTEGGLLEGLDLKPVRTLVRKNFPKERELNKAISERARFLASRVRAVKEVLARYRRHATLGQLIDVILHDGRTPIAKIENEAELGRRDAAKLAGDSVRPERIRGRFELIGNQAGVVSTLFQKLEPFGGRRRGRPASHSIEELIENTFAIFEGSIGDLNARVSLPPGETKIVCEPSDVQQIIANLLDNSLYWLGKVPKQRREILVEVARPSVELVSITFCDSGPGVEEEFQAHIFEPYFTTKPEGVGLGLAIAGEIAVEYGGSLELLGDGPLPGACFRVTLKTGGR